MEPAPASGRLAGTGSEGGRGGVLVWMERGTVAGSGSLEGTKTHCPSGIGGGGGEGVYDGCGALPAALWLLGGGGAWPTRPTGRGFDSFGAISAFHNCWL